MDTSVLLALGQPVRILPGLEEHWVVVPALHPGAHHDERRWVGGVDRGYVLIGDLLDTEVQRLPLLGVGLFAGLLDQPVGFRVQIGRASCRERV